LKETSKSMDDVLVEELLLGGAVGEGEPCLLLNGEETVEGKVHPLADGPGEKCHLPPAQGDVPVLHQIKVLSVIRVNVVVVFRNLQGEDALSVRSAASHPAWPRCAGA